MTNRPLPTPDGESPSDAAILHDLALAALTRPEAAGLALQAATLLATYEDAAVLCDRSWVEGLLTEGESLADPIGDNLWFRQRVRDRLVDDWKRVRGPAIIREAVIAAVDDLRCRMLRARLGLGLHGREGRRLLLDELGRAGAGE